MSSPALLCSCDHRNGCFIVCCSWFLCWRQRYSNLMAPRRSPSRHLPTFTMCVASALIDPSAQPAPPAPPTLPLRYHRRHRYRNYYDDHNHSHSHEYILVPLLSSQGLFKYTLLASPKRAGTPVVIVKCVAVWLSFPLFCPAASATSSAILWLRASVHPWPNFLPLSYRRFFRTLLQVVSPLTARHCFARGRV
mgnify:CR=1 FL=1